MKNISVILGLAILLSACQNKADRFLKTGEQKKEQGDYLGSIEDYKKGLLVAPKNAILFNNLGISYEKIAMYKEAYEAFSNSIKYDSKNWLTYYNRAGLNLKMKDTLASLNDCNKSISLNSDALISYALKARILNGQYKYDESIRILKPLLKKIEDDKINYQLGNSYYGLRAFSEALYYYKKASELQPSIIEYQKKIAGCYYILQQPERAMSMFDKLLANKLNKEDAELYYMAGYTTYMLGDIEKALEFYTISIKIDSNNAFAYANRAYCYDNLGDFEKEIEDYTSALKLDSTNSFLYLERGVAKIDAMRVNEAYEDIYKSIKMGNDSARIFIQEYPKEYVMEQINKQRQ